MGIPINEVIRDVESPLTEKMLRPPHPRCQRIQFRSRLSDPDFRTLADWLQEYPWVALRAYDDYLDDLEFLRFFPTIRQFMADGLDLTSFYGLQYLPGELSHLSLGQTRKRLSLAPIGRFTSLRRLFLEGHTRDIDVVQQLRHLSSLTLRSITLTDLSLLLPLRELRALDIKLGGTHDLALLPRVGALRYLELWSVRGLHDLSPVGLIPTLEFLFIQSLRRVTTLPSFARCVKLRRVHLETLKGLTDLTPLLTAAALSQLTILNMPQLQPANVAVLSAHPALREASVIRNGQRKNEEVARLLPLPAVPNLYDRHAALHDLV